MGYEIKMSEIIAMRRTIEEIGASYANEIENARVAMARVTESDGLKGKTADAIRYYISEVYGETERAIKQAVIELRDKIMVYESGYIDIDGSDSAHITQETLETTVPARLNANKDQFADYASCLNGILSCVSDIYSASLPETGNISGYYEKIKALLRHVPIPLARFQRCKRLKPFRSRLKRVSSLVPAAMSRVHTRPFPRKVRKKTLIRKSRVLSAWWGKKRLERLRLFVQEEWQAPFW